MKNIFASIFLIVSIFLNSQLYAQTDTLKQSKLEHWYGFNLGSRYGSGVSYAFKYKKLIGRLAFAPYFLHYPNVGIEYYQAIVSFTPQVAIFEREHFDLILSQSNKFWIVHPELIRSNFSLGGGCNLKVMEALIIQVVSGIGLESADLNPHFDVGVYYRFKKRKE